MVYTGHSVFRSLSSFLSNQPYSSYFILCDENTFAHCLPGLITQCPLLGQAQVIEIESGEQSKSIDFCQHIWQTLLEEKAGRHSLLINLGGGVVSDLGGFAASVYKRGIDFITIPTSLLAMADASVGGKTGIDFGGLKNSIGSFAQPKAVFVNSGFLHTLPARHYKNGLAEVYKIALVSNAAFWQELNGKPLPAEHLIRKSIGLKNAIVQRDPFDKGLRKTLNFGHTLGHAIEALALAAGEDLLHGEAVVAGMLVESHIAWQKKLIAKKDLTAINKALQSAFQLQKIRFSTKQVVELMANDKKTSGSRILFALIDGIGSCRFDVQVSTAQLEKAILYYNQSVL